MQRKEQKTESRPTPPSNKMTSPSNKITSPSNKMTSPTNNNQMNSRLSGLINQNNQNIMKLQQNQQSQMFQNSKLKQNLVNMSSQPPSSNYQSQRVSTQG